MTTPRANSRSRNGPSPATSTTITIAPQRGTGRARRRSTARMASNTSAPVVASAPAFPVSGPPLGVKYTAGSNSRVRFEYWFVGMSAVQASPTASAANRRASERVPRHTPMMKQASAMMNASPARARTRLGDPLRNLTLHQRISANAEQRNTACLVMQHVGRSRGIIGSVEHETADARLIGHASRERRRQLVGRRHGVEQRDGHGALISAPARNLKRQIERRRDDGRAVVRQIDRRANRPGPGERAVVAIEHDAALVAHAARVDHLAKCLNADARSAGAPSASADARDAAAVASSSARDNASSARTAASCRQLSQWCCTNQRLRWAGVASAAATASASDDVMAHHRCAPRMRNPNTTASAVAMTSGTRYSTLGA